MKSWEKFMNLFTLLLCLWGYLGGIINPTQPIDKINTPITLNHINTNEAPVEVKPFNVLLLGIDARKQEASRTDVIMVANINPQKKTVYIISIPRDTRVELPGVGYTKINHAHLLGEIEAGKEGGTEAALAATSALLQCQIHYYAKIDFSGFASLIDVIGGIEIKLEQPLRLTFAKITLPEGEQHLDGNITLKLVRERYSLPDGDFGRQKLQFLVLKAVGEKILQPKPLLKLPKLIKQLKTSVIHTNFTTGDLISYAWMMREFSSDDITYIQLPGQGGYAVDSLTKTGLYYWYPDLEQVQKITKEFFES